MRVGQSAQPSERDVTVMPNLSVKNLLAATVALILVIQALGSAQASANLAGTWTFDSAKSDPAPQGRQAGGFVVGRCGVGAPATQLVIKQDATELTVNSTLAQCVETAVYKLNGGESIISGFDDTKAMAMWDAGNLVITTKKTVQGPGIEITFDGKEIYSLAGGTLTIVRTQTTPQGSQTRKLVYNKSS